MDLKNNSNENFQKNKIIELKIQEAILKDQLNRIIEIEKNPSKKVFVPLNNNSKLAFFEAKIKGTPNIYTNISEYVIESTIDRKINKINKAIASIQSKFNKINKN